MFGSGIPTTEKSTDKRYFILANESSDLSTSRFWNVPGYEDWKEKTPVLVPFIPGVFKGMSKKIFCCEFSLYSYGNARESEEGA
jgi:hypothetical protein